MRDLLGMTQKLAFFSRFIVMRRIAQISELLGCFLLSQRSAALIHTELLFLARRSHRQGSSTSDLRGVVDGLG